MQQLYSMTSAGTLPVLAAEAKSFMKIPSAVTADDTLITSLLTAVTGYCERYTGRSSRAQGFSMWQDAFETRITLKRSPVDAITTVEHMVDDALAEVSSDDYYLKKGRQWSEVLLVDGTTWPTTTDVVEHAVKVVFTTAAWAENPGAFPSAIRMMTAYLYENRGDCDHRRANDMSSACRLSGASYLLDPFRVPRIG